jgi:hypothetical protein
MRYCQHRTRAQVAELCVGTRECGLVRGGARDGRDPRLAPWWTGRSVRRRLLAHLTEQAGSARISPGGHLRSNLVLERVVVWKRLCVCVTRGRPTRKQRRGTRMCASGRGGEDAATNALCTQGCQEVCTSQDVSPRRGRAGCKGSTPPMLCIHLLAFSLHPSRQRSMPARFIFLIKS